MTCRRRYIHLVPFLGILLHAQSNYTPDATQQRYERKSITIINTIFHGDRVSRLTKEQEAYFFTALRQRIEMARFDYNIIPDRLTAEFREKYHRRQSVTIEELRKELERKVVPAIVKILDYEKEMRVQNLLTEVQKNSFLAVKAKSLGITAEQLEKIMNSAYIYIPYLEQCQGIIDGGQYEITLNGGIIEYQILFNNNVAAVRYGASVLHQSKGIAMENSNVNLMDGVNVPPREFAYMSAVKNMLENVQISIRQMDYFNLTA